MARVFTPNGWLTVNVGWLVRYAGKHTVSDFRITKAKYSRDYSAYLLVRFEDSVIFAMRFKTPALCKRWIRRAVNTPHFSTLNVKGFDNV